MNIGDTYELRFREVNGDISVDAPVTVLGFCDDHQEECVKVERSDGEFAWVDRDELFEVSF